MRLARRERRPVSRCAHASVSANVGVSATAATSSSTSCRRSARSPAQIASLSISFASWWKSSPTRWIRAAHGIGLGARARLAEAVGDPLVDVPLRDLVRQHLARLRAGLASGASFFSSSATSASTVPGAGDARYASIAFTSAPSSRLRACRRRSGGRRRPRRPRAARRRRGSRHCRALRHLHPIRPAPRRAPQPRARSGAEAAPSAVSIFGRSLPVSR